MPNKATKDLNPMDQLRAQLAQSVRAQIESELNESLANVDRMQAAQGDLKVEIAHLDNQIADLKASQRDKAGQLHEVNAFLLKFSPEGINQLVTERIEGMIAVMHGEPLKKARTSSGGRSPKSDKLDGYTVTYAIDGKPRSFGTKTHLTYWLGQKVGRSVSVAELSQAFATQTGCEAYSEAHKEAGTLTADIEGIQVTITLAK